MNSSGYERFILLVEEMQKAIRKIKLASALDLGVKGVHVFWLERLHGHPEGLTAAELAQESRVDRSLISREIEALARGGYVKLREDGRRYVLTESGVSISEQIVERAREIQTTVNNGISESELEEFYRIFEKLRDNFRILESPSAKRRSGGK